MAKKKGGWGVGEREDFDIHGQCGLQQQLERLGPEKCSLQHDCQSCGQKLLGSGWLHSSVGFVEETGLAAWAAYLAKSCCDCEQRSSCGSQAQNAEVEQKV